MTPFESYFAAKIQPALKGAPQSAVDMAKASAADIWNAALDSIMKSSGSVQVAVDEDDLKHETVVKCLDAIRLEFARHINAARVTP